MVYTIYPESINDKVISDCVERLLKGETAIIPTDSVYAVVGDFQHPKALKKLADIKRNLLKSPSFIPFHQP